MERGVTGGRGGRKMVRRILLAIYVGTQVHNLQ